MKENGLLAQPPIPLLTLVFLAFPFPLLFGRSLLRPLNVGKPMLQAKHVDAEGFVTDSYEQKFAVPDDVDTARLSSGISKDGVLMIRVPRRPTEADRLIPIQYDAKIEAVEKALSQAMQSEEKVILDG